MKPDFQVVEDNPELIRDTYSKGITNRDTSAYDRYMNGALARKARKEKQEQRRHTQGHNSPTRK